LLPTLVTETTGVVGVVIEATFEGPLSWGGAAVLDAVTT
jgi:hypothetical protein